MSDVALLGETDDIKPWTLRSMPVALKDAVVQRAHDEHTTASLWAEDAMRAKLDGNRPGAVGQPGGLSMAAALDFTLRFAALPADRLADPLVRTARRNLRAALIALR